MHAALLAWSAYRHSPTSSEIGHLPAGISHWRFGRFDLYRVNPPLVRMVAAVPMLWANPASDWSGYTTSPTSRSEGAVGTAFVAANGPRIFWLYTLARWACIPFSLVGAVVCYLWARDLYGRGAGLAAAALWCFCPNILGNAALLMPDAPAAALGVAACYTFWKWLLQPTWARTFAAGLVLGLAELTKTTLVVLLPLWPLMWLVYRWPRRREISGRTWLREAGMLAMRMLLGVYVINLGYGFEGSFQRLGDYRFQSRTLTGLMPAGGRPAIGNRFQSTCLASLPVPLPKNYLQGIDAQKVDFERGMRSYLNGRWSDRGWWHFYLYALGVKVPLGTLALVALSLFVSVRRRRLTLDESMLLLPAVAILVLVSSQSGFSIHFRYILPIFPYLFVWASKPFGPEAQSRSLRRVAGGALVVSIAASLWVYPHSLSYFNTLAGGPARGYEHLLESSVSWGQDVLYLKKWCDAHPQARPLFVATSGGVSPSLAGVQFDLPSWCQGALVERPRGSDTVLPAGWYVIDVNYLQGAITSLATPDGRRLSTAEMPEVLERFRRRQPIDRIGYSHRVFHLDTPEPYMVRPPAPQD